MKRVDDPQIKKHFVVTFRVEEVFRPLGKAKVLNDFTYIGDKLAICLSILFGKKFENSGMTTSVIHHMPNVSVFETMTPVLASRYWYNNNPRADLKVDLNLEQVGLIVPLLQPTEDIDSVVLRAFWVAGRYYQNALRIVNEDVEAAYLNLVTSGEVMANALADRFDPLPEGQLRSDLLRIERELDNGTELANRVRRQLRSIKKRFVLTLCQLLNDEFYSHSESPEARARLDKESIEERLGASYDLRSRHLHSGSKFSYVVDPEQYGNETHWGVLPSADDKEMEKVFRRAPTFVGLERIIRFCLLRFIHLNLMPIASQLD